MTTERTQREFRFKGQGRREIVARFDGGTITSDGGAVLLAEAEKRTKIVERIAGCFRDQRSPERVEHKKPTATSIVLQGTNSPPAGIIYGQGVRCVGGTLKRLFTKAALAGSITAPDFGAGHPTVSARSAAKGDAIQPGQSRWYLVYCRDPTVLGGCPASSTFNATQTGRVNWSL